MTAAETIAAAAAQPAADDATSLVSRADEIYSEAGYTATVTADAQALTDILADLEAETLALDDGGFATDDAERQVHRYLRRRGQTAAEIERVKAQTAALLKSLTSDLDGLDYIYRSAAEAWCAGKIAGKKARSVKTPFGTVGFRASAERLEVVNDAAVIEAAQTCQLPPDTIRLKTEVSKSALAALYKQTGEVPPGCEVVAARDSFYVK